MYNLFELNLLKDIGQCDPSYHMLPLFHGKRVTMSTDQIYYMHIRVYKRNILSILLLTSAPKAFGKLCHMLLNFVLR